MRNSTKERGINMTKKRPSNFHKLLRAGNLNQIKGERNKDNATFLINQLERDGLSIVYAFRGPAGTGKTTTCFVFGQLINCAEPTSPGVPCGVCSSCLSYLDGIQNHDDTFYINGAAVNKVDDIKELVKAVKQKIPKYNKVVIILDEWHNLSDKAMENLLNIFEDAKPGKNEEETHYVFLLPTTSTNKVPPALLSRGHVLDYNTLTRLELHEYLSECCETLEIEYKGQEKAFDLIFDKTNGAIRDSLKFLEQIVYSSPNFEVNFEVAERVLKASKSKIAPEIFKAILELNMSKASLLCKKHNSEVGFEENDFNDLFELLNNHLDDSDCQYNQLVLIDCLETIIDGRNLFISDSSAKSNFIFQVTVRKIITLLQEETINLFLAKVLKGNQEFGSLLKGLNPSLRSIDGHLTLEVSVPPKGMNYFKSGFESSFMEKTLKSFHIKDYKLN